MATALMASSAQLKHLSRNAAFTNGVSHGHQFFERSLLDRTLSFVVDEQRTLFGLFLRMAADFDQRINDVFEGIDIIIENHEVILVSVNDLFKELNLLFLISLHKTRCSGF
jgi:hypothetical protein